MNSEVNRQWALKIDDRSALAPITCVLVAVEPKGGARRRFYANLRTETPNDPGPAVPKRVH